MPRTVDIGTLIKRSPDRRKGRPRIAGTGVTVRRIAGWHNLGLAAEEIAPPPDAGMIRKKDDEHLSVAAGQGWWWSYET